MKNLLAITLSLFKLKKSRDLEVFNDRFNQSEDITHIIKTKITIDKHIEKLSMFVTKLEHYFIVLEKL